MKENIEVSIICNAYNHEKYIEDALKGFVMQETTFLFEVLVHDDASTDQTAEIIRRYEKEYPNLIKPLYQEENQYSKGIGISSTFQYPRAKGKYIAYCEGDDYWVDTKKLQKQYDAMEAHLEVDLCATAADVIDAVSGKVIGKVTPLQENGIIPVQRMIKEGGGIVATASLFGRKEFFIHPMPFRKIMSFDYTLQINGAIRGGVLYLAEETAVYRASVLNGWTCRMKRDFIGKINHKKKVIRILRQLDKDTKKKYHVTIQYMIISRWGQILILYLIRMLKHHGGKNE